MEFEGRGCESRGAGKPLVLERLCARKQQSGRAGFHDW
jgi:hypothetical protein